MNIVNKGKKKASAIVAMAALVAAVPVMLGGLISIGDVRVLSPNCDQDSTQTQIGLLSKLMLQSSNQAQDCDSVDVNVL